MYRIELLQTNVGYRYNFRQGDSEKIITWAGSDEAMNIPEKGLAIRIKESLEKYPVYFDANDNMIIPSPLYFLLSVQKQGVQHLIAQIENWPIFWSQDAFFHRSEDQRIFAAQEGVARFVKSFLEKEKIPFHFLPFADYGDWDELEEDDFLNETELSALRKCFESLSEKEKIAVLYIAFNSPHFISAIAWIKNQFPSDESFAHYSLVLEGIVCPLNMDADDFEKEVHLREEMFNEVRFFVDSL